MLLNEIFDTRNKVIWKQIAINAHQGEFEVDGEIYFIDAHEYEIQLYSGLKSVLDVGFRKGTSSLLTAENKPGRVIGSVLNGLKAKVSDLKPNIIMFGVLAKNGDVEKRKSTYSQIAHLFTKITPYSYLSKWYNFSHGEYAFMADFIPSHEDDLQISQLASTVKQ